jgi:hypothetical protein
MAKYHYVTETIIGTITRRSDRVYTHVVVGIGETADGKQYHDCRYCGRPDLVKKQAASMAKEATRQGVRVFDHIIAYPVGLKGGTN